jgi:UDP-N-acetylmuramyl tripeptide synthase
VPRTREALADAADWWFGRPSERLEVIGVTGTDGKTTTCYLAVVALEAGGRRPGMIGTVAIRVGDRLLSNEDRNTTPEALELQALLAGMVEAGNDSVVMEATSHGLAQSRVRNCRFRIGIVTNVTSEHLEFHGTLEAYRAAKAVLVEEAPLAILNADDPAFGYFRDRARDRVLTCPVSSTCTPRWPRWRWPMRKGSTWLRRLRASAPLPACRAAWSGSMPASRSGWWSTTPTPPNRSRRCCAPSARSRPAG